MPAIAPEERTLLFVLVDVHLVLSSLRVKPELHSEHAGFCPAVVGELHLAQLEIYSTHRLLPVLCCWAPRLRGGPKSHEGLAQLWPPGQGSRLSAGLFPVLRKIA